MGCKWGRYWGCCLGAATRAAAIVQRILVMAAVVCEQMVVQGPVVVQNSLRSPVDWYMNRQASVKDMQIILISCCSPETQNAN